MKHQPKRPSPATLTINTSADLKKELERLAHDQGTSVSKYVDEVLRVHAWGEDDMWKDAR